MRCKYTTCGGLHAMLRIDYIPLRGLTIPQSAVPPLYTRELFGRPVVAPTVESTFFVGLGGIIATGGETPPLRGWRGLKLCGDRGFSLLSFSSDGIGDKYIIALSLSYSILDHFHFRKSKSMFLLDSFKTILNKTHPCIS